MVLIQNRPGGAPGRKKHEPGPGSKLSTAVQETTWQEARGGEVPWVLHERIRNSWCMPALVATAGSRGQSGPTNLLADGPWHAGVLADDCPLLISRRLDSCKTHNPTRKTRRNKLISNQATTPNDMVTENGTNMYLLKSTRAQALALGARTRQDA